MKSQHRSTVAHCSAPLFPSLRLPSVLLMIFIAVSGNSLLAADPNPKDPFLPIAKVGVASDSNELWQQLATADAAIRKSFDRLNKGRGPDAKEVSKLYVSVEQFRRWQKSLEDCYEPAAVDYRFREVEYGKFLAGTLTQFWATPQSGPIRQRALTQLQKSFAKRTKEIQSFGQLLASDPRAAEAKLDSYYDKTFALGGLLSPKNKRVVYDNLTATEGQIRSAMQRVRRQQSSQDLNREIGELRGKYETLINDSHSLQLAGTSGQWKGQTLDGPELFAAIVNDWKAAHLAAVRYAALQQMMTSKGPSAVGYGEDYGDNIGDEAGNAQKPASSGEAAKLASRIIGTLAKIIAHDAENCPQNEALNRYHDYIAKIADLKMRLDASAKTGDLEASMIKLGQTAGIETIAYNYHLATSDILDWRRRFARASKTHLQQKHPLLDSIAKQQLTSKSNDPKLYTVKNGDFPVLLKPIPAVVADVEQTLGSTACSVERLRSLDNGNMWMSSLTGGFYSRVRVATTLLAGPQVQSLKLDLLAAGDGKPLTTEAAAALLSAGRGDFECVGGQSGNIAIESSLARYCALPPIASNLVPIGFELPKVTSTSPRSALAIRFDLSPRWFQHEYFIVHVDQ